MEILGAKHNDQEFSCFKDRALYNAIRVLSTEGFDKIESNFNSKWDVLLVEISDLKGKTALTLRIHNPSWAWKLCTGKMVKKRLKNISDILWL